MNDHVITKRQNPVMQGVVQLIGQARRVLMSELVSARDRANQDRFENSWWRKVRNPSAIERAQARVALVAPSKKPARKKPES